MVSIRNFYHPLEAAILWSDLGPFELEIVQAGREDLDSLVRLFPQWPYLHTYVERIYDAIYCHELPATFLGQPVTCNLQSERAFFTIRHSDLRIWISRYFPDDKPAFLFNKTGDHTHCISLGAYLVQEAEIQTCNRVIEELRIEISSLKADLQEKTQQCETATRHAEEADLPSESSKIVFYMIIGALLDVSVGSSPNGQTQSIYKNQSAMVEAIITRYSHLPGISKRTLDRKFAEGRRHLTQAGQA